MSIRNIARETLFANFLKANLTYHEEQIFKQGSLKQLLVEHHEIFYLRKAIEIIHEFQLTPPEQLEKLFDQVQHSMGLEEIHFFKLDPKASQISLEYSSKNIYQVAPDDYPVKTVIPISPTTKKKIQENKIDKDKRWVTPIEKNLKKLGDPTHTKDLNLTNLQCETLANPELTKEFTNSHLIFFGPTAPTETPTYLSPKFKQIWEMILKPYL